MMSSDQNCIFCRIVAGEAEASIVFRDDLVTAFMDLFPVSPGHVLVIPNHHAVLITELESSTIRRMFEVGAEIDRALRESAFRCEAVSLYLADGAAAGQAVFHTHLHVIPRFQGDSCGLRLHVGPVDKIDRELLDKHAEIVRSALL
jgi:histidine triad (HIT) family protein